MQLPESSIFLASQVSQVLLEEKKYSKEIHKRLLQSQISWLTPVIPDLGSRIMNIRSLRPSSATL